MPLHVLAAAGRAKEKAKRDDTGIESWRRDARVETRLPQCHAEREKLRPPAGLPAAT
ncbi:hypothetical protein NKJ90_29445 [Mesorhizobium sp. M0051]|uniref:hypothetical protein n=1 Tax=unclassified Mesorhizobium TaxID=325217 RepID=UPI0012EC2FFB|nr:hypothetical protein [Mesorhizobium sp. LNHC252B00]